MTKQNKSSVKSSGPEWPLDPKDVESNRIMAIVAYLGILCLLPLLLAKDSKYARFHGQQGLILLIFWLVISVVAVIPILGWIIAFVGYIAGIVLTLIGIMNAARGEAKELPWIGHYAGKLNL